MSAGCRETGQDQGNGPDSATQDFITRTVDKVVQGIAARLDTLSEQLAEIHQAHLREHGARTSETAEIPDDSGKKGGAEA